MTPFHTLISTHGLMCVCVCKVYVPVFAAENERKFSWHRKMEKLTVPNKTSAGKGYPKKIKLQLRQHIYIHYAARKAQFCLRFRKKLKPIHCRDLRERKKKYNFSPFSARFRSNFATGVVVVAPLPGPEIRNLFDVWSQSLPTRKHGQAVNR